MMAPGSSPDAGQPAVCAAGDSDTPIISSSSGLGLDNVHKRLQLHYGTDCGLWISSVQGEYTCVTLRLPWENENLGGW